VCGRCRRVEVQVTCLSNTDQEAVRVLIFSVPTYLDMRAAPSGALLRLPSRKGQAEAPQPQHFEKPQVPRAAAGCAGAQSGRHLRRGTPGPLAAALAGAALHSASRAPGRGPPRPALLGGSLRGLPLLGGCTVRVFLLRAHAEASSGVGSGLGRITSGPVLWVRSMCLFSLWGGCILSRGAISK